MYENKLNFAGLVNLGIGFKTEKEMLDFQEVVSDDLNLRVGTELSGSCSDEQIKEFEALLDSNATEYEQMMWINENVANYREIVTKNHSIIKQELLTYRDYIDGISPPSLNRWAGHLLSECNELTDTEVDILHNNGIDTYGELSDVDDDELYKLLCEDENMTRVNEIRKFLEKTKSKLTTVGEVNC